MNTNLSVPQSTRASLQEIVELVDSWDLPATNEIKVEFGTYKDLVPLETVKNIFPIRSILFTETSTAFKGYAYLYCKREHSSHVTYYVRVALSELKETVKTETKVKWEIPESLETESESQEIAEGSNE